MINPPSRNRFNIPNIPGAATGGVIGVGLGATLGLAKGLDNAAQEEERQLRQVQSIADPYARKQAWDLHTSDTSTLGRDVNKVVKGGTGAIAGGLAAGTGGALLGAAGVAGYKGLKKVGVFSLDAASLGAGLGTSLGIGTGVYAEVKRMQEKTRQDPRYKPGAFDLYPTALGGALLGGVTGYAAGKSISKAREFSNGGHASFEIPANGLRGAVLGGVGGALAGGYAGSKVPLPELPWEETEEEMQARRRSATIGGAYSGLITGGYLGGRVGSSLEDVKSIPGLLKKKFQTRGMSTKPITPEDTAEAINVAYTTVAKPGQYKPLNGEFGLGLTGKTVKGATTLGTAAGGAYLGYNRDGLKEDEKVAGAIQGGIAGTLIGTYGGDYLGSAVEDIQKLRKDPAVGRTWNKVWADRAERWTTPKPVDVQATEVITPPMYLKSGFSTGALIGSGLGAVKGSLDQPERQRINPDGSITPDRYSPVERVAVVGANAGAGAGIGAVVSNIPGKAIGNAVGNAKANVKAKLRNIYTRAGKYVE